MYYKINKNILSFLGSPSLERPSFLAKCRVGIVNDGFWDVLRQGNSLIDKLPSNLGKTPQSVSLLDVSVAVQNLVEFFVDARILLGYRAI